MPEDPYIGRKIRFGIVGCGAIGPTHARAIDLMPGAELVAVADLLLDRASKIAERFSVKKIYGDQRELFSDPAVDVVCLCTPSGLHGDGAVAAMQAGKHVVVEKPMEISVAACDRMIAAQIATGKLLTVISQHRFDPASLLVKDLIDTGKLGKIILATAEVKWWRTQNYYDEGEWRGTFALDGGGAVINQGIHTVDVLQWLAGEVETVYAQTRTAAHDRIEVEDVAVATLTFKNGAIGSFIATTAAFDGLPVRIDLFGQDGSAVLEGDRLKRVRLKSGEAYGEQEAAQHALRVAGGGTASAAAPAALPAEGSSWEDAHCAQLEDFERALRCNGTPLIDGLAGRAPVRIIMAIYESARTGKPVRLG